jgi:hypothetical protein
MNDASDDSDAASSHSSTPLMALKKAKIRKQQKSEEKKCASKTTRMQPKLRKSKTTTTTISSSSRTTSAVTTSTVASGKAAKKTQKTTKAKSPAKQSSPTKDGIKKDQANSKMKTEAAKDSTVSKSKRDQQKKNEKADDCTSIHTSESEDEEEEEAACCLCHCGVDCSDRALFFPKDRKSELEEDKDYYFGLDDPYLDGETFHDRNNALVYCDTCNRLYHQKCHFVPLLVVPRGEFHCLICTVQQHHQKKAVLQGKKKHSKKRERKGSIKNSISSQVAPTPEKFLKRKITDQLFQSPPTESSKTVDIKALEKEWEKECGPAKARLWDLQFKQLRTFLKSQASNIRMANTTLATMTSTKRNRQHFLEISSTKTGTKSSQELAQTLCKLTGAKFKIREALLSVESLRVRNESIAFSRLSSWCQDHSEHANHVFPFGSTFCKEGRRIVPRTRERKQEGEQNDETARFSVSKKCNKKINDVTVPSEITLDGSPKASPRSKRGEKKSSRTTNQKNPPVDIKSEEDNDKIINDGDDDSGITLDDLQCAVCMIGDATDENDVILCDGKDCHRAFHMKCVYPPVKQEDIENQDEDWFCPMCSHSAELMGEINRLCVVDDDENDDASTDSWEDVHDVFPGSEWEYETAMKILKGKRNEDTQRLLAMFLGEDINKKKVQMPVGSDSEDENDYSLFDEDSFQERRRHEREDENDGKSDDDDSTCSSQATLQEMDDIDYKVGKSELAALSDEECSESNSEDENENKIRRSRRLEKIEEGEESNPLDIGADFDEANIIDGKRKRKRVNYRKLNDMMFGDLSDHQQGIIDGGDDFKAANAKPMKAESDNESGDNGSDKGSDNESDNDSDDNPDN